MEKEEEVVTEPFDTSCEICGRPNCWPICYDCERREAGY